MKVVLEETQEGVLQQVPLIIRGLTSNGYLRAEDDKGDTYELHPDGNRWTLVTRIASICVPRCKRSRRQAAADNPAAA